MPASDNKSAFSWPTRRPNFRRIFLRLINEGFEHARRNIQAAVQAAAPEPMESVVLLAVFEKKERRTF
jgi:hypothetical protein